MHYDDFSHADRRVPLCGAVNFRDLGGYLARDGRHVRWRSIYRSDSLADLTPDDIERVSTLELRTIFDLRHESERIGKPNRLPPHHRIAVHMVGFFPFQAEEFIAAIRERRLSRDKVSAHFLEMYRRFPIEHLDGYVNILRAIARPEALPALVHCTSGKDRTGFAVATILMALGVPRETIIQDYLLTNKFQRDLASLFGADCDAELMLLVTQARSECLGAAFDAIDQHWGSDEAFLGRALLFDHDSQSRLRDLLLET